MTKKRIGYILLAIAICLIVFFAHRADQANRAAFSTAAGQDMVGTWRGDTGSLFQFRSDGTGRSRNPNSPASNVHYFEWEADDFSFTMIYAPRGAVKSWLARKLGTETVKFQLSQVAPDSFTIVDAPSGTQMRFDRTEDETLDDAY